MLQQADSGSGQTWRVLLVLAAIGAIGAIVGLMPGAGVQQRLDASQGADSERFRSSLARALDDMSPAQRDAYDWAVGGLDGRVLVDRYGQHPSARQIVVGEASRFIDRQRRELLRLQAATPPTPAQAADSDARRTQALARLKVVAPRVVSSSLSAADGEPVAAGASGSTTLNVVYRLTQVDDQDLAVLPCKLAYRFNGLSSPRIRDFNCVGQTRMPDGSYVLQLPLGPGSHARGLDLALEVDYREARVLVADGVSIIRPAMPDNRDSLEALRRVKRDMRLVLAYKASM